MLQIPFSPQISADQEQRINLDGQMAVMRMTWNVRSGFWFLTLSDDYGNSVSSLKVVPNYPLLRQYRSQKPITGDLICLPIDSSATWPPAFGDLGVRWFLFWISEAELKMWEANNGLG